MKNHTDVLMFSSLNKFRRLFVSERKQIALMADEKLHAQISCVTLGDMPLSRQVAQK